MTTQGAESGRLNALSVDVEDWYHDSEVVLRNPPGERVDLNTYRLLELFAARGARATFFFLGEVAEHFPQLVRDVAAAGHEIASHGFRHRPVTQFSPRALEEDVASSVALLESITGTKVLGYRAPYFSIHDAPPAYVDALQSAGIIYDSSMLSTKHRSGNFHLIRSRHPFRHANGLLEIPVAMLRVAGLYYLPLASGGGLRFLGVDRVDQLMRTFEQDVGPAVFYLHPWELDVDSPTAPLAGRWLLRFGRDFTAERLAELLRRTTFAPIREVFAAQVDATMPAEVRYTRASTNATLGPA